jgi:hypothetical protein
MTLTVAEYLCLTTGTTSGAGSAYPSEVPPRFSIGFLFLNLFCVFCRWYGHCIVCSSIYGFIYPLWYLQTCLTISVQSIECSKCICTNSSTVMSQKELQDRLNYLHSILSIDHRNTSSFLRTKTSATDNRPSSVSIGITGVILLVSVMLFIILLDILPRN